MKLLLRFFCFFFGLLVATQVFGQAILQGTVSFLNSGSRPAVGVDISAFGASTVPTTESGMFILKFPEKKPGDKLKIIVGSKDRTGAALELVNDKVLSQVRVPSKPDDDVVEIIVCKVGQRNEAALRYNGIIVKTVNDNYEKTLREINQKLAVQDIDAGTIVALQNEKDKLTTERDSALAKAEEQALFIASINLDKANRLVTEAVTKVDSLQDIAGAIVILDNEMLYQAYLEASEKKKKAEAEIQQVVSGFEFKIKLLQPLYRYSEIAGCYEKIAGIYEQENYDKEKLATNFAWAAYYWGLSENYQKQLNFNLKALPIFEKITPVNYSLLATSYNNLAVTYAKLNEYQKALEFNLKSLSIWEEILPADHPNLAICYNNIGDAYRNVGDYEKGVEYGLKSILIGETIYPKSRYLNRFYANLGITYLKAHQYPEAKAVLEKSENLKADEKVFRCWAMYYSLQNDKPRAIENLQKAISLGYRNLKWITTDDSLENIRGEQAYKDLVEQLQKQ